MFQITFIGVKMCADYQRCDLSTLIELFAVPVTTISPRSSKNDVMMNDIPKGDINKNDNIFTLAHHNYDRG